MKRIIEIILLASILSIAVGCKKENPKNGTNLDCLDASFTENYSMNIQNDGIFFIKGIALDMFKYGRKIKVIEDLKGNFTGNSPVLVWGEGRNDCIEINRWDHLSLYNQNDTLIMMLEETHKRCSDDVERSGDYATVTCAYSILKLSNGNVSGYITPQEERDMWYKDMSREEMQTFVKDMSQEEYLRLFWETMQWDELQKKLNINSDK
jgi:hypothetical protein